MEKMRKPRGAKKSAPKAKGRKPAAPVAKAKEVFHQLFDRYADSDWVTFANQQRANLVREVRTLGEEIISKIADSPIFAQREELIREARHHLDTILQRLNRSSLLSRAMDRARITSTEILSFLNIPSQGELKRLQKKLNQIESRLSDLQGRAPLQ